MPWSASELILVQPPLELRTCETTKLEDTVLAGVWTSLLGKGAQHAESETRMTGKSSSSRVCGVRAYRQFR